MKEEYKKCLSMLKNIRENGFLCGPIFALKELAIFNSKKVREHDEKLLHRET